ncbi:hypothetical protein F4778DRAFT_723352 [Xylariomycetidae sp. FL2044]|nr:hypothetical protein F4778DRAFT_723352 [Xylariomycetidae sp. FL2044]
MDNIDTQVARVRDPRAAFPSMQPQGSFGVRPDSDSAAVTLNDNPEDSKNLEQAKKRLKKQLAIRSGMAPGFSELLDELMGLDVRKTFRDRLVARGNIPSIGKHFCPAEKWRLSVYAESQTLWVVDRTLEWQTIGQFLLAAMAKTPLPNGESINHPLNKHDWFMITKAYSDWVVDSEDPTVPIEQIQLLVGSMTEGTKRLQIISKELQGMKSRLWEGIMPLSARRWREKKLYEAENFPEACRILSMVVNVFIYLNSDPVQAALRETFVLIDSVLRTFEGALNTKRALEGQPHVEVSNKWHQFVRAKYEVMVNRSHSWVLGHLDHMKGLVLERMAATATLRSETETSAFDDEMMKHMDMWQDLSEITSQADYGILMPMHGYAGSDVSLALPKYNFRTQPLRAAPSLGQRNEEYHQRRGHLTLRMQIDAIAAGVGQPELSDTEKTMRSLREQDIAQKQVRAEIRGEPAQYNGEPWARLIRDFDEWGFVVYRTCYSCSADEWIKFREKFEADQADWGSELEGVERIRKRSKLHWIDAKNLEIDGSDMDALRRSFGEFTEADDFPPGFPRDMFLVADEASVASYLKSQSECSPSGDDENFICVVDAKTDPEKTLPRPQETPGYGGTMRVLGSLLWDDVSAQVASYALWLDKLWPLAMNRPSQVYAGPVTQVQDILPRLEVDVSDKS